MSERLKSIDILRALTMLLMIVVNDLWTLEGIPHWLGHASADEDRMGLADVVFPAFLFIVGLSIPHAIGARLRKGHSRGQVLWHILERSLALWIMGLYMVNLESIQAEGQLISKTWWQLLMVLAFFLIWNVYRRPMLGKRSPWVLKGLGWGILAFLAVIYKGHGGGWMAFHWWGILGLIGWGYFLSALLYLFLGKRLWYLFGALALLLLLNINEFSSPFAQPVRLVVSASNYFLVFCGVVVSSAMLRMQKAGQMSLFLGLVAGGAVLLGAVGLLTRPAWGISKILATPSWSLLCAAIGMAAFVLLYLLADKKRRYHWARIIGPAGSMTLTCYLLPYYVYAFRTLLDLQLPEAFRLGIPGLLKSVLFALLIIQLTGLLGRLGVKLKI